jgi:hypothetical protein
MSESKDLGVEGRIILKPTVETSGARKWSGFK